jgi:hypothetical protein
MVASNLHFDKETIMKCDEDIGPDFAQHRPMSSARYLKHNTGTLALWCKFAGLHGITTLELLDWLRTEVGDAKAIEIGAGRGILGMAMGWPQTDAKILETYPHVKMYYEAHKECTAPLPPRVQKFEALEAVSHFQPEVVVGSWITQKSDVPGNGSMYGVEEDKLLKRIRKYIVIGNRKTHQNKDICKLPHKQLHFNWIVSRSVSPSDNVIYIWNNPEYRK